MSSKKTSFEPRDSAHPAEVSDNGTFGTRDPVESPGDAVEFSLEEDKVPASDDGSNKSMFESRDLTTDLNQDDGAVSDKASFYARDPDLDSGDKSAPTKKKYMGVERRKENRRSGQDRRGDVRFDLDKNDRRKSEGRREGDHTPKYW